MATIITCLVIQVGLERRILLEQSHLSIRSKQKYEFGRSIVYALEIVLMCTV